MPTNGGARHGAAYRSQAAEDEAAEIVAGARAGAQRIRREAEVQAQELVLGARRTAGLARLADARALY